MTRYYYDVSGDTEGLDFDNIEEAKEHAVAIARYMARDNANGGLQELDLVVRDEYGERFRFKLVAD